MTAEALQAPPAPTDRDAGWRDIAAVLGARALSRLRLMAAAVRPLAWVLMGLAVGFWILGRVAGWAEFTIAAIVIAMAVAVCALFLIGRTAYDVSLDLARTRVVVGSGPWAPSRSRTGARAPSSRRAWCCPSAPAAASSASSASHRARRRRSCSRSPRTSAAWSRSAR